MLNIDGNITDNYQVISDSLNNHFSYLLTYLVTPWYRVLLEQLTGLQLVKKFPAFHGTPRFITALTSICRLSILGQPNPVHIPTSHLLEIHPNIIHPSTPRSPQWSLSLRFPHQDPIHTPLLTLTRHMPSPSHSSRFYNPQNIIYIYIYIYIYICVCVCVCVCVQALYWHATPQYRWHHSQTKLYSKNAKRWVASSNNMAIVCCTHASLRQACSVPNARYESWYV